MCAYARATLLYEVLHVLEFGRAPDAAEPLADLLAYVLTPRASDAFTPPGRPSAEFRGLATGCRIGDPELERALAERGVTARAIPDPGAMLRCLDAGSLARRLGAPDGGDEALLRRLLPPERFSFWPADRF